MNGHRYISRKPFNVAMASGQLDVKVERTHMESASDCEGIARGSTSISTVINGSKGHLNISERFEIELIEFNPGCHAFFGRSCSDANS